MSKYGDVSRIAVILITKKNYPVVKAWNEAAQLVFPNSTSARDKGCPKSAFLGLCSAGYVKGVPKNQYTKSVRNMEYALKAVDLLRKDHELINSKTNMWSMVCDGQKSHNGQLDVVFDLWVDNKLVK